MCMVGVWGVGGGVRIFFFFQAEDGIRDLVRSRGLGDVYKRQGLGREKLAGRLVRFPPLALRERLRPPRPVEPPRHLSLIHI